MARTFTHLRSLILTEESFSRICSFRADHWRELRDLTQAERSTLEDARLARMSFLADRLAERALRRAA